MTIVQVFNKSFRRLFVPAEYWAHFIKNTIRTSSATFKQGILCSRRILCLPFRQNLCIVMLCGRALRKENKRICLLLALWESSKVKSTESLLKKRATTQQISIHKNYSNLQKNVIFLQTAALRFDWIHHSHISEMTAISSEQQVAFTCRTWLNTGKHLTQTE